MENGLIALFNPIEEIQISTELEQLRVNRTFNDSFGNDSKILEYGFVFRCRISQ